jgi:hypothetical protein
MIRNSIFFLCFLLYQLASADCDSSRSFDYQSGPEVFSYIKQSVEDGAPTVIHSGRTGVKDPVCFIAITPNSRTFCELDYPEGKMINGVDFCDVGYRETTISGSEFQKLVETVPDYIIRHASCRICNK